MAPPWHPLPTLANAGQAKVQTQKPAISCPLEHLVKEDLSWETAIPVGLDCRLEVPSSPVINLKRDN